MCIVYSVRHLCGHLVHLDDPPVTPCSKIRPESLVQSQTRSSKSSKKTDPKPPSPPLTRYCVIPLLPTIFHSDQVCRVCSAGLLAYARRVYFFEVGWMMLKMPTRVERERELYFKNEADGEDHSLEYYEKNIIDRILSPAMLLKCWVAWRLDRERFRALGVCGGEDGELGRGCLLEDDGDDEDGGGGGGGGRDKSSPATPTPIIGARTSKKKKARAGPGPGPGPGPNTPHPKPHFPNTYFFDPFLGDIIYNNPTNLEEFASTPAEKALKLKLRMLDAIVEARCLEAHALEQDGRGCGLIELVPILARAARLRQYCAVTLAGGEEGEGGGDGEGDGKEDWNWDQDREKWVVIMNRFWDQHRDQDQDQDQDQQCKEVEEKEDA